MERDELLERFCVQHGAPVPDDVVSAGRLLLLVYRDVAQWERALTIARAQGFPVVEEVSEPGGRGGTLELTFDLSA